MKTLHAIPVSEKLPKVGQPVPVEFESGEFMRASISEEGYWWCHDIESDCDEPLYWYSETPPQQGEVKSLDEFKELLNDAAYAATYGYCNFEQLFTDEDFKNPSAMISMLYELFKKFQHQPSGEVEMESCECGHTVPIEFAVTHSETGNSTCMPCHLEFLNDEEYRSTVKNLPYEPAQKNTPSPDLKQAAEKFALDQTGCRKGEHSHDCGCSYAEDGFKAGAEWQAQHHQPDFVLPDENEIKDWADDEYSNDNGAYKGVFCKGATKMLTELKSRGVVDAGEQQKKNLSELLEWFNSEVSDETGCWKEKYKGLSWGELVSKYLTSKQNKG